MLILASLAPAGATRRRGQLHEVGMTGGPAAVLWAFEPEELTIATRDRVAWSNATSTLHHVTFYEGPADDSLHVPSGGVAIKRFKKPGTYLYRCDINTHSYLVGGECVGMCGSVTVE